MKFKNIRGYSNGKIKFKNIQDFRRPVRTLGIVLMLPLSSNIVDFILPGWRQLYIATAQNWPATWQTRPTETSEMVAHCTCTPCFKFCTPTFKILPNTLNTGQPGKTIGSTTAGSQVLLCSRNKQYGDSHIPPWPSYMAKNEVSRSVS